MLLQPVILGSQNATSAVNGATTEPRIRINRPDEENARCRVSRVRDQPKNFSQPTQPLTTLSTSKAISPPQKRTEPSVPRRCRRGPTSGLRRKPDMPADLLRALFGNVTAPFQSAAANAKEKRRLGWGELKARAALDIKPATAAALHKQPEGSAYFPFLDTLIGADLGIVPEAQRRMMQVEALQLSQSAAVEAVLAGVSRPEQLTAKDKLDLADALLSRPGISTALKSVLQPATRTTRQAPKAPPRQTNAVEEFHLSRALDPRLPRPHVAGCACSHSIRRWRPTSPPPLSTWPSSTYAGRRIFSRVRSANMSRSSTSIRRAAASMRRA